MSYDIITIGSATRDVFLLSRAMHPHRAPDALTHIEACFPFGAKINIEQIHFDTGGGATNNAATFARLGKFRTAALCRVGKDSAGQDVLAVLKHDGVDTSLVQIAHSENTGYGTILSPGGDAAERTILVYRGASHRLEHAKISWNKLRARWFYISSLDGDLVLLKKILAHAKKIGAKVAWNPGGQELVKLNKAKLWQEKSLALINFLILNREEAAKLTGAKFENTKGLLHALARLTPSAIMTDGPKGAYAVLSPSVILSEAQRSEGSRTYVRDSHSREILRFAQNDKLTEYYVPSAGHKPKNLTGAGDAFGSGFLTGWIKSGGDIKYALRLASFNADSVVQHLGAKVGILKQYPSLKQLEKLSVQALA